MKRVLSAVICFLLVLTMMPFLLGTAQAAPAASEVPFENAAVVSETCEELEDGYYLRIITYTDATVPCADRYTKTVEKKYIGSDKNGGELFELTIRGTFLIEYAVFSICTGVSYDYEIYNTDWHFSSAETSKSDYHAFCTAVFKLKVLGIVIETKTIDAQVSCNAFGVAS